MGSRRAGTWVQQVEGYRAFIPRPLPPAPAVVLDGELARLLSDADRALGRLDGVATILPNPDLFVAMYVRHEAVLSSQIEGTQSTLDDVLAFEAEDADGVPKDVDEVVNYVAAMSHGLSRLPELPLSLRLMREIHEALMRGVRGQEKHPGEFRTSQNWIGPAGCTLSTAEFVPPPPHAMHEALHNLETFLHDRSLPPLLQVAFAHAQFETIHPFLDGNGRVGRLLITLFLCERKALSRPLLYLSIYLKAHRAQYYDRLTAIRSDGDWEGWLRFFLRGVLEVSESATLTAHQVLRLRESIRETPQSPAAKRLIDPLFAHPVLNVKLAAKLLDCTFATANKALDELLSLGIVRESTGQRRNRRFRFEPYLRLFERTPLGEDAQAAPPAARTGFDREDGPEPPSSAARKEC